MAFIPIPVFIPLREEVIKSEEEIRKLREINEKFNHLTEKIAEKEEREKEALVKQKKLKHINKQVSKNGFTVSNFRALCDHSQMQELSGKRLKKIKKIYEEMHDSSIFIEDLDISANGEYLKSLLSNSENHSNQGIESLSLDEFRLSDQDIFGQQVQSAPVVKSLKIKRR